MKSKAKNSRRVAPVVTLDCHPNVIIAKKGDEVLFQHVTNSGTLEAAKIVAAFVSGFKAMGNEVAVQHFDGAGKAAGPALTL